MQVRTGILTTMLLLALVAPLLASPAAAQSCVFPHTETDATGTDVTLPAEPQRVVTLGPSTAQTMWEIGARETVVGLSKHASYLEGAESRTTISTSEQLVSIEAVVDLQPDLVLAPQVVPNETVRKLREVGVTVFYFPQAETIEDVYEKTRRIGRLTGECRGAAETVASMRDRVSVAREATAGEDRPDVLYLFFGYTAGEGTFIDEIIETAGGNNVAADANVTGYQPLNPEVVLLEDPDWIVLNSENPAGISSDVLNQTTAYQENQTVVLPIEHLNQPAPRIVRAVTTLAQRFHPEAYAAANATVANDSATTATATPSDAVGDDTSAQPGFGIPVVVTAIAAALLLWRRDG